MKALLLSGLCILLIIDLGIGSSLELVQVFFRHGSRTPELKDTYPKDIYKEKDFQPMGWGQLTNEGKFRAYTLGNLLRRRYDSFLGDICTPGMVAAQSTDFDRTKMSLLLVLAGLFPPSLAQKWHDELQWIPIPYTFEKAEQDFFLRRPTHYCPKYLKEKDYFFQNDPNVLKILEENKNILEYITIKTDRKITTLYDVFNLYQTLNAEDTMNLTLPTWTASVYPEKLFDLAGYQCFFENSNHILKRLNGGRSLSRVLKNIHQKITNSLRSPKIYLYSGHENNVVNVLSALDVFEHHMPKYSSAVIIELHNFKSKEHDDYKVRILYVRDAYSTHEPEVKVIDKCQAFCPYQQFVDLTSSHIPTNYTEECESIIPLD